MLKFTILSTSLGLLLGMLTSCGKEFTENLNTQSRLGDIYKADNDPKRRHKATPEELLWTVNVKGCSGHMLAPDIVLTANHCAPQVGEEYQSGSSYGKGGEKDMTVVEVLEKSPLYDLAILKVEWKNGKIPDDQIVTKTMLTNPKGVSPSTKAGQGDEVFTVGFPADKTKEWGGTWAKGRLKTYYMQNIKYNIGIINGNSGGAVWRMKDKMLVSMTNGGPHYIGQDGWNNNDTNDSKAWNWGGNLGKAYNELKTFKRIFPKGKSIYFSHDD